MPVTILIVENHDAVRQALRDWLQVTFPRSCLMETTSKEEAIALVHSASPHLVVVDIDMPRGNGLKIIQQIKTASPTVKILIVSSYDDATYRAKAIAAGASAYVTRQAILTELIPSIDDLIADIQD